MADKSLVWKDIDLIDPKSLARAITRVENNAEGSRQWLASLSVHNNTPIIGITGSPGAGKSTIVNGLIHYYDSRGLKIAVIAVDPTSPFSMGSLLGDRIRMSQHYSNPNVFIRSLATRGSLGGLSAKTIEITDIIRAAGFDIIIIETVGVGQSEVEIAGIADTTVLVLVPEGGDDIQNMKSGIMEIADIFVVNKADRPGSDLFKASLKKILHQKPLSAWNPPIIATMASENKGIENLAEAIETHQKNEHANTRKVFLLAEKAYQLIQSERMKDIDKHRLAEMIQKKLDANDFNLYGFVEEMSRNFNRALV